MGNLQHYYQTLGLQTGAGRRQIREAFRDLCRVWHPDRFYQESPQLQRKAEEQLKAINEAYQSLIKTPGLPEDAQGSPARMPTAQQSPQFSRWFIAGFILITLILVRTGFPFRSLAAFLSSLFLAILCGWFFNRLSLALRIPKK